MKNWDHEIIIKTLLDAGEIALTHFKKTRNSYKKDGSIVTEADLAVERFLKERLHSADQCWIGEESAEKISAKQLSRDLSKTGFIIDPIDGTMNYANGLEMWGISIGYIENGQFSHGGVYLPCCNEIFITQSTQVLKLEVHQNKIVDKNILLPIDIRSEDYGQLILSVTQAMAKHEQVHYPGPIHSISSAVYTICKLITGAYGAYIGKLKIWDLAAVYPMCKRLNIDICFKNSEFLDSTINPHQFIFDENDSLRFSAIHRLIFSNHNFMPKLIEDNF